MLFLKVTKEKHEFVAGSKFTSIGPIYYEYGSMIITFDNSDSAVQAYELLRVAIYEDKKLLGEPYTTSSLRLDVMVAFASTCYHDDNDLILQSCCCQL